MLWLQQSCTVPGVWQIIASAFSSRIAPGPCIWRHGAVFFESAVDYLYLSALLIYCWVKGNWTSFRHLKMFHVLSDTLIYTVHVESCTSVTIGSLLTFEKKSELYISHEEGLYREYLLNVLRMIILPLVPLSGKSLSTGSLTNSTWNITWLYFPLSYFCQIILSI